MSNNRIFSLLKGKCPNCETGDVFADKGSILRFKSPVMNETCPHCNYKFEREPGFFFGAMYASYALTVAEAMSMIVAWVLLYTGDSHYILIILITCMLLLLSFTNFRLSRLIWMYMFPKK